MSDFVLDASIAIAWCFDDEQDEYADAVLDSLENGRAYSASIWPLETGNTLLVAERRNRISAADSARYVSTLRSLPVVLDASDTRRTFQEVLPIARMYNVSSYDASYLELAQRMGLRLATLDRSLKKAMTSSGVGLYDPLEGPLDTE